MAEAKKGKSVETSLSRESDAGFDVPGDPGLPKCPVCKIGELYTIAYDPDALHEKEQSGPSGDATAHANFVPSGGAITLQCFNCGMKQTQPLNPGKAA